MSQDDPDNPIDNIQNIEAGEAIQDFKDFSNKQEIDTSKIILKLNADRRRVFDRVTSNVR